MALRRCGVRLAEKPKELAVNVDGMGTTRYNETAAWNFWNPVWGGKSDSHFDEEYYTRREMSNNFRVSKPSGGLGHFTTSTRSIFRESGAQSNPDMAWAGRQTPDSAIEVEATTVTCFGSGSSNNTYFTPLKTQTGGSERANRHHMSWIFVPPDRTAMCQYCRTHFKRKPGWTPGFDANLLPSTGVQPKNTSLDPCLMYVFVI